MISTSSSYSQNHQDGFELELRLLASVLERNRCSHGRTKYYQRLSMAHRCIRQHNLADLYSNAQTLESELSELKQTEQKLKKRKQVFWEIGAPSADDASQAEARKLDIRNRLECIGSQVLEQVPTAISRLEFAAKAVFAEIARGFFLPFNSVAVAAAARIRTLLLRLAIHTIQSMPTLQADYIACFSKDTFWTNQQLNESLEKYHTMSTSNKDEVLSKEQVLDQTLHLLGISLPNLVRPTKKVKIESTSEEDDQQILDNFEIEGNAIQSNGRQFSVNVDVIRERDDHDASDLGEQLAHDEDEPNIILLDAGIQGRDFAEGQASFELDRNHELVQQVADRKKKESKKRKSKSKDKTDALPRNDKKKAKKSSKGDFFDELFG